MATDKKTVVIAIIIAVLAIVACVAIVIAVDEYRTLQLQKTIESATSAAEKAKEDAYKKIGNTPADDLVGSSPHAEELAGTRDKLIDDFSAESRDRIRQILQRGDGQSAP